MKINENTLAKAICSKEGGKVRMPIGQVKEVLRITLDKLAKMPVLDVLSLIIKHKR